MPRRYTTAAHAARNLTTPPVTAAPVTMACWYRPATLGSTGVIMQLGDHTAATVDQKWRMVRSSGNQLQFIAATTSATTLTNTGVTMEAGVWYHCLISANATFSPNRAVINASVATSTAANRVPVGVNSLVVGAQLASTSTFSSTASGDIFWPVVWNAQLTADEEALLANGLSPLQIRPQNLVFFNYADDQRRLLLDAMRNYHLELPTTAASAQYIPDIPPQVAARMPRRTAKVYAFPSGVAPSFNPAWAKGSNVVMGVA
jgi:hypothetical protein